MHFWPKFGNTDFNLWWLIARTSSKWGKFWLLSSIWPWSSRSIIPKNNRDLNQGLLHLWSKFGDSSLNGWWVTARTSWWLTDRHTHTHTHTHAGNDNTRRPKLASGKNLQMDDVHNLINFGPTNPIQILNQHENFWRFCMCPSNDTFDKNKNLEVGTGAQQQTECLLGIKQT